MADTIKQNSSGYLGKYREILIAVAFFLVFDLAVLVLNFYISFQISQDAVSINMAGRQRMLSQRMTKSLLTMDKAYLASASTDASRAELLKTSQLFDATLQAFMHGGQVTGSDDKPVMLSAAASAQSQKTLADANAIWQPYKRSVQALLQAKEGFADQLGAAGDYALANNLKLLKLMNDLTTQLEHVASNKANKLRQIQTGGILLALLNFGFILFKFIRRLRENDKKIEAAQNETQEILGTVKDGLFLIDKEYKLGSQYSLSLPQMLGRPIVPGESFLSMIAEFLPKKTLETVEEYISLIFTKKVKESLVRELNPLQSVESVIKDENGKSLNRTFKFDFKRVMQGEDIAHLLVTVVDISAEVELTRALEASKQSAKAEMEVMLQLFKIAPATLGDFLNRTERTLEAVNAQLRNDEQIGDLQQTINAIFRKIHAIKGDAAVLGLDMFENTAQSFEAILSDLRDKAQLEGEDLLALPLPLDEFLKRIAMVRELMQRLAAYGQDSEVKVAEVASFEQNLKQLANRIAGELNKQVVVSSQIALLEQIPDRIRPEIKEISIQLLRNAVFHGIETKQEREAAAKSDVANVELSLIQHDTNEYELVVRDDGRGLDAEKIKANLISRNRYTERYLNELDDRQIIMKIFEPGFSTADEVSRDAGHGVGLDVVHQKISRLGARMRVSSARNKFTQFSIVFSV